MWRARIVAFIIEGLTESEWPEAMGYGRPRVAAAPEAHMDDMARQPDAVLAQIRLVNVALPLIDAKMPDV